MEEIKKHILTQAGLQEKQDELHNLIVVKRDEVAKKIQEAREQGDLSENAEYDAAMDEQRSIEARIKELQDIIKNAEVVDESSMDLNKVNIGCTVRFLDVEMDEELEYRIVGSIEADIMDNKISNESPVGKALIGASVGETVQAETADGMIPLKIISFTRETPKN